MKKAQRNNYERVSMPTISEKLPDIDEEEIKEDKKRVAEFIEKKRRRERTQRKLTVTKVTDKTNLSAAETTINAWRELRMPVDTKIADKEKYWNDMVYKLFDEFNKRMEQNINEYLNMYVKNNYSIKEYK